MKEGKDSKVTLGATPWAGPLPRPRWPCRFGPPFLGTSWVEPVVLSCPVSWAVIQELVTLWSLRDDYLPAVYALQIQQHEAVGACLAHLMPCGFWWEGGRGHTPLAGQEQTLALS